MCKGSWVVIITGGRFHSFYCTVLCNKVLSCPEQCLSGKLWLDELAQAEWDIQNKKVRSEGYPGESPTTAGEGAESCCLRSDQGDQCCLRLLQPIPDSPGPLPLPSKHICPPVSPQGAPPSRVSLPLPYDNQTKWFGVEVCGTGSKPEKQQGRTVLGQLSRGNTSSLCGRTKTKS